MSILSSNNPIRFFKDKRARQWERTPENIESMVYYPSETLPMFQVIVDKIALDDSNYDWAVELYDHNDIQVDVGYISMPYGGYEGAKMLTFFGDVIDGLEDGYYYYKLYNLVESYYSDMFALTDVASLLKFEVQSSPVRMGGYDSLDLSFSQTFYLSAEPLGIKPKTDQNANLSNGIDVILFGTRVIVRDFELDANESIYIYLTTLGLLQVNGAVTIGWQYESWNATDFVIEETTNHGDGLYQLKLSFVDESETVSVING